MRWKTHKLLTRMALAKANLGYTFRRIILDHINDLDRERKTYETHHKVPLNRIMNYIWKARRLYLQGKLGSSAISLSYAIHLIQDRLTPAGTLHDRYEKEIDDIVSKRDFFIPSKIPIISSPNYIENMLKRSLSVRNLRKRVSWAYVLTNLVADATFTRNENIKELIHRFDDAKRRHGKLAAISILIALFSSLILAIILDPLGFLLPLIFAYIIVRSDSTYYRLEKEVKWNDPDYPA
ncbi:MAG: hypothetical protein ACTSVW_01180 [Candidatus Njordarchaeales archaeon]